MNMCDHEDHNKLDLGEVLPGVHLIRACRDDSRMSREDYALAFKKNCIFVTFDTCPWPDPFYEDDRKLEELEQDEAHASLDWAHAAKDFESHLLLTAESVMSLWWLVSYAQEVGWKVSQNNFGPWLFHRIGVHLTARKARMSKVKE